MNIQIYLDHTTKQKNLVRKKKENFHNTPAELKLTTSNLVIALNQMKHTCYLQNNKQKCNCKSTTLD